MTGVTNLFRDQLHASLYATSLNVGTRGAKGKTIKMHSDGVVKLDHGMAYALNYSYAHVANSWGAFGVLMQPPVVDATPYRVKAYVYNNQPSEVYIIVGHSPLSPTGNDDLITNVIPYPFGPNDQHFDDVILIPSAQAADVDKPIAIGIAIGAAGAATALIEGNISVQNLARTAPQFAASMS